LASRAPLVCHAAPMKSLEVLFSPAEFAALRSRDLSRTVCVVFDILRATSTMVTALAHGAEAILPVNDIPEALAAKQAHPAALLAGERHGLKIGPELTGGVAFDLGNSPREFTRERISGRTVIMTTTNGTRALRASAGAREVLAGSFLNLAAINRRLRSLSAADFDQLLLVCSGTYEEASFEDTLAAGALADRVWDLFTERDVADSAQIARQIFLAHQHDLVAAMASARNGRRLLASADLRADVEICLGKDSVDLLAELGQGMVRRVQQR
jgi:2-phosphosulfolactate phosphatase